MEQLDRASVWLTKGGPEFVAADDVDVAGRVDVVVVGAGLAGLCTAVSCVDDGASVMVLEAGRVAGRTTGHSTAKLTALHGTVYSRLVEDHGRDTAAAYAAANVEAVGRLRGLIDRFSIDCDLVEAAAYTCAATAAGVREVELEASAAAAAGLDVEVVTPSELPVPIECAVTLDAQAHFDPVALADGLVTELRARGVSVVEGVRVAGVEERRDGCVVRTDGFDVRCDAAVLATHLPVVDPALLAARLRPERSYVAAGPAAGEAPSGMYLAVDQGWSLRPWQSPDGPGLIVGGEGHEMVDHVDGTAHDERLRTMATERFGVDVTSQWSAFDYATSDGLPLIGRLSPRSSRRYTATGFHKWGMSTSMVAAMILGDLIAGRPNPYAETFDSTRIARSLNASLVRGNLNVAKRFVGDRVTARRRRDDEPGAGEGIVVRRGTTTIAVARGDDGQLHSLDAACTHLGCVVAFNRSEQTWDCPCHGSRFGIDGSVIDGPATEPLRPVEPPPF